MIFSTLSIITISCFALGLATGLVGSISFIRKQTLLADAISHATLPGIAFTFLCLPEAPTHWIIIGGSCTGLIGAFLVTLLIQLLPLKKDAIIGTILSVFLGIGLILMTMIQKTSNARQACLNKFLYGNASLLLQHDMITIVCAACIIILLVFIMLPTYQARLFDCQFADVTQCASYKWDVFFTLVYVTVITIGIQAVGIILISSMLICPALTIIPYQHNFITACIYAMAWGGCITVMGSLISYFFVLPPGPCITLTQGVSAYISILLQASMQMRRV